LNPVVNRRMYTSIVQAGKTKTLVGMRLGIASSEVSTRRIRL